MTRILIIDDDRSTLLLYEMMLREEGFEVATAASGPEGLQLMKSERPDLVVLDVSMPGMDGLEVLARILAIDRKVPIVLNSGYSFYRKNFLSWSADAYVVKSSDPSELKDTIFEVLSRAAERNSRRIASAG
jgi:DNA-binding response OmpR family regulator